MAPMLIEGARNVPKNRRASPGLRQPGNGAGAAGIWHGEGDDPRTSPGARMPRTPPDTPRSRLTGTAIRGAQTRLTVRMAWPTW